MQPGFKKESPLAATAGFCSTAEECDATGGDSGYAAGFKKICHKFFGCKSCMHLAYKHRHMEMEKVRSNIFNLLNKGLRALIYDAGLEVQQMQLNDPAEAAILFDKIKETLTYCVVRAEHTEKTIFAFIPSSEALTVDKIRANNCNVKTLAKRIAETLDSFKNCLTDYDRTLFAIKLTDQFYEFSGCCLFFLSMEEAELKKILGKNYDEATMCALGKELLCKLDDRAKPMIFKHIIRGTSEMEIVRLLNAAKHAAPASELQQLMLLAETELIPERWMHVQDGLQDGLCL